MGKTIFIAAIAGGAAAIVTVLVVKALGVDITAAIPGGVGGAVGAVAGMSLAKNKGN